VASEDFEQIDATDLMESAEMEETDELDELDEPDDLDESLDEVRIDEIEEFDSVEVARPRCVEFWDFQEAFSVEQDAQVLAIGWVDCL